MFHKPHIQRHIGNGAHRRHKKVFLSLAAQCCHNREKIFWPRKNFSSKILLRRNPYRRYDCDWRNAKAKILGYKAHRYCRAGEPVHDPHILREIGLWPHEAVRLLPSCVELLFSIACEHKEKNRSP